MVSQLEKKPSRLLKNYLKRLFVNIPEREYSLIVALVVVLVLVRFFSDVRLVLGLVAAVAVFPTLKNAWSALCLRRITIDIFNTFAIIISFATGEFSSAAFIALMLTFARLLDWHTESRTRNAISELLSLKPQTAFREQGNVFDEIPIDQVRQGDVLLVKIGSRMPVDGRVVTGSGFVNEASVTGESALVEKVVGDQVLGGTLVESGTIKIRAEKVGKESTLERMVALMEKATKHKSRAEKLADRFATIFLPLIALLGLITYLVTKNISMTTSLFLVACADDMAVAIPLALTASLGRAARRGVIIKGGEWLEVLGKMKTLVLDKTGTLTFGSLTVREALRATAIDEKTFWQLAGSAEKFSEHPAGKAVYRQAVTIAGQLSDPEKFEVIKGGGVRAVVSGKEVVVGNEKLFAENSLTIPEEVRQKIQMIQHEDGAAIILIFIDGFFAGLLTVADEPRPEAALALRRLRSLGVNNVMMFTGDTEVVARRVATSLGITTVRASLKPEEKLHALEGLTDSGVVGMIGDGINDAPALARADVGIAMGGGGTAVAVEAADVVILTDNLLRLPEMVELGRKTSKVIRGDMIIWFFSNLVGFVLVFTGFLGPALAAFYNFITDFFPLINSSRLFSKK